MASLLSNHLRLVFCFNFQLFIIYHLLLYDFPILHPAAGGLLFPIFSLARYFIYLTGSRCLFSCTCFWWCYFIFCSQLMLVFPCTLVCSLYGRKKNYAFINNTLSGRTICFEIHTKIGGRYPHNTHTDRHVCAPRLPFFLLRVAFPLSSLLARRRRRRRRRRLCRRDFHRY